MRALGDDAVGLDLPEWDALVPEDPEHTNFGYRMGLGGRPDTVWHLAALNGSTQGFYDRPWDVLNVQVRGTLNVIDACVANGVKTLVLFSSSEVFQTPPVIPTPESVPFSIPDMTNPRFSYAAGKQCAEMLAWYSPIPRVIVLRPFNVYGPGQGPGHVIPDLIYRIASCGTGTILDVAGVPSSTRAYCYVDDFISGARRAVAAQHPEHAREVYNVGVETETPLSELVDWLMVLSRRSDSTARYVAAPSGSVARRCPDVSKLRAIGWSPSVALDQGLVRTVAAYREANG